MRSKMILGGFWALSVVNISKKLPNPFMNEQLDNL